LRPVLGRFFSWFATLVAGSKLIRALQPNLRRTGRAAARGPGSRFPRPSFALKFEGLERIKQKSCLSTVWAFRPKKGEFFFARSKPSNFRHRRRRRTSRVAFSFGYFSFGDAKEKCLGRRAETRLLTGDYGTKITTKLIAKKPIKPPANKQNRLNHPTTFPASHTVLYPPVK
jgi:hypothetical protein